MKTIILIILSVLTLQMSGCATHYIPSTCPTTGEPPVMTTVKWVRICIAGDKPDNAVCFRALASDADILKLKQNFKELQIYADDCFLKIGEQPSK